jgi:hypothetical protein
MTSTILATRPDQRRNWVEAEILDRSREELSPLSGTS